MALKEKVIKTKSLRGILKQYAKPESKENYVSDYTKWRKNLDTGETIEEISRKAMALRDKG
jgi:hypothetical protein